MVLSFLLGARTYSSAMLQFISSASSIAIASWAFSLIFGAAILGFLAQRFIPTHHFSNESKDAAKLCAGLVATLAALMLGLLISSTKGTFDQVNTLMNDVATNYIHLDRLLSDYGPEAAPLRKPLREALETKMQEVWPEEYHKGNQVSHSHDSKSMLESLAQEIAALKPTNTYQNSLQNNALQLDDELLQERWRISVIAQGSVPALLLVVPVIWISLLTLLYALLPHEISR